MLAAWYQSAWYKVAVREVRFGSYSLQAFLFILLLGISQACFAWKMEAGVVTLQSTFNGGGFTSIAFQQTYDVAPLVFMLASEQGGDPSDIRVRAITSTGFQAAQVEPPGNDGPHVAMTVHYIAIEPGSYTLPNGSLIQAGSVSTTEHQRGNGVFAPLPLEGWEQVNFTQAFADTPAVIGQIQTMVNESSVPAAPDGPSIPWMTTTINDVNTTGFDVALERSQANDGNIAAAETIGWLAMEDGAFDSFTDNSGNSVNVTAVVSGRVIRGWDDGSVTVNFSDLGAGAQPVVGATLNTHRDNDGGWVRYRQNSATRDSVKLRGDEDRDADSERGKNNGQANHAGVIAFSQSFNASFSSDPDLLFLKRVDEVVSDPITAGANKKAIPDSVVQYQINVSNHGDGSAGQVVISDAVPLNTALFVGDINGLNSGPIRFEDGATASGLSYSYTPLTPTLDSLEFSQDNGSSWGYQPTPDADGFDDAVTNFRVNFGGSFASNPGGAAPSFDMYFRVRVN